MKIDDRAVDFLKLLMRSPDIGGGWRKVSVMCVPLVEKFAHQELIETQRVGEIMQVRLTERGRVLCDYI